MPDQPLVSIIIPILNRAHLIGETLDSVIAQTYQNWECIVVDDGSTDNTPEVMAEYIKRDSRIQYHLRPPEHKPGGNGARNYGFKLSKGEFIQWFDSDDIMLPLYLEKKLAAFKPENKITICTGYAVDADLSNRRLKQMPQINNLYKQYTLWQSKILSPSVLFRASFLKDQKLFDEELLRGQENELFSRYFFEFSKTDYTQIDDALYLYRQHENTKSFEDKHVYNSGYRKSMGQISLFNLKRGMQLNDPEIINFHYQFVIHYLFEAFHKKNKNLARYFLLELQKLFKKYNPYFVYRLKFWTNLFLFSGRSIYRIEKKLKNNQFA